MGCKQEVEFDCGPLRVRRVFHTTPLHDHAFDHTTFCVRGQITVRIELPGDDAHERVLDVGDCVEVPANAFHAIVITPNSGAEAMCVFPHRNRDGEIIPHFTGWDRAYAGVNVK